MYICAACWRSWTLRIIINPYALPPSIIQNIKPCLSRCCAGRPFPSVERFPDTHQQLAGGRMRAKPDNPYKSSQVTIHPYSHIFLASDQRYRRKGSFIRLCTRSELYGAPIEVNVAIPYNDFLHQTAYNEKFYPRPIDFRENIYSSIVLGHMDSCMPPYTWCHRDVKSAWTQCYVI